MTHSPAPDSSRRPACSATARSSPTRRLARRSSSIPATSRSAFSDALRAVGRPAARAPPHARTLRPHRRPRVTVADAQRARRFGSTPPTAFSTIPCPEQGVLLRPDARGAPAAGRAAFRRGKDFRSARSRCGFFTPRVTRPVRAVFCSKEQAPRLFAGDTLFRRSIGRTDLWGGDTDQILIVDSGEAFHPPAGDARRLRTWTRERRSARSGS